MLNNSQKELESSMWTIHGQPHSFCDGISRRDALRVGSLTAGGLSLSGLLKLRAASAGEAGPTKKPRSAILIFLAGGPSHFETFDPKPDAPREIRGPYNPISTAVPGVMISETLPKLAAIADRFSLVRSCAHDNSGHGGGQRYVQTGYKSASLENELPHDYPVLGSIVSKLRGAMNHGLPTFIRCPDANDGDAAFLGNAFNPFPVYSTGKPVGLEIHPHVKLSRLEDRRSTV